MTNIPRKPFHFETEDFEPRAIAMRPLSGIMTVGTVDAAELANAILKKWLDEAPIVYGPSVDIEGHEHWDSKPGGAMAARLVQTEEIK